MKKMKKILLLTLAVFMLLGKNSMTAHAGVTLVWPVPGHTALSQGYHDGKAIDISDGSISGAPVCAALGGTVTNIWLCGSTHLNAGDCNGFGTGLVIRGDDGRFYQYAHMQAGSIPANVYRTARVEAGQQIGRVGSTGWSTGPHLHFGITTGTYYNNSGINPQKETYRYTSTSTPSAASISWGNDDCKTDTVSAFIYTKATASARGTFTQAGATVWDTSNAVVASKTENINTPGSYLEVWYNIKDEMGVSLKSGTNYKYQFFVVFNGKKYTGPMKSFKTTGTAPVVPHVHSYTKSFSEELGGTRIKYVCSCGHSYSEFIEAPEVSGPEETKKEETNTEVKKPQITVNKPVSPKPSASVQAEKLGNCKLKSLKIKKKKVTLKWRKVKNAQRYEVCISTKKNAKGKKYKVSGTDFTSPKLKKGKKYYVKVRAYSPAKSGGKTIYGRWSKVKKVKIK